MSSINNNVNNNFPTGLTATGTTNLNTTGSGVTTLGSSSSGAVNIASNAVCSVTLNNQNYTLTTGTGSINFGTDATSKNISIGSSSTTSFTIQGVTASISSGTSSTGSTISRPSGNLLDAIPSGSTISIDTTGTINVSPSGLWGLAAAAVTIGNTSSSSSFTMNCGTGGISIAPSIAKVVTIGNTTGATQINFMCGTGGVAFPFHTAAANTTLIIGINTLPTAGSLLTFTLPTTAAVGSMLKLIGFGSGGWKIAQNSGQTIHSTAKSTTTGTGGSLSSGGRYDAVTLVCTVANTDFVIVNSVGTLAFV